jgi:hypothetical protein
VAIRTSVSLGREAFEGLVAQYIYELSPGPSAIIVVRARGSPSTRAMISTQLLARARPAAAAWAACRRPSQATVAAVERHLEQRDTQQAQADLENHTA